MWLFYTLFRKSLCFAGAETRGVHPSFLLWVSILSKYLDIIKMWRSMETEM